MSITVPIHQAPYGHTFQGPIEPDDITDNRPQSLYVLCCKYIVQNISKITIHPRSRLPPDVCDNLIELFRIYGSKKACNTFLASLSCKQCTVVSANLSNLDISDEELTDFLDSQRQTLKSLNISNCNRLSPNVLLQVNRTLLKVHDINRIKCMVTIYEVPKDHPFPVPRILARQNYPFVMRKFYDNGKILTEINKIYGTAHAESFLQNSIFLRQECPEYTRLTLQSNPFVNMTNSKALFEQTLSKSPKTAYEFYREMGLFCHPAFTKQYFSQKKPHVFACYDRTSDDHRIFHSGNVPCPMIRANQIIRSKANSLFPDGKLEKGQCAFCYGSGLDRQTVLIMPKSIFQTLHYFRKTHYYRRTLPGPKGESFTRSTLKDLSSTNSRRLADSLYSSDDDTSESDDENDSEYSIGIDIPEDDDDSYFEDDLSYALYNSKSRPIFLPVRDLGFSFNNLHLKSLLSSCDRLMMLRKAIHGPHKPEDPTMFENPRDFLLRISDAESESAQTSSSMSSSSSPSIAAAAVSAATASTATSSSCPVLSSCSEAAYLNFETDQFSEESPSSSLFTTTSTDKFTHHNNNHNFPQLLKKFRPQSDDEFDSRSHHSKAQCSRSSNVGGQVDPSNVNPGSTNDDKNQFSPASLSFPNAPLFGQSGKLDQQHNESINENHKITCPLHPRNAPPEFDNEFYPTIFNDYNYDVTEDLLIAEDQLRLDLFPYKVYRVEQPDYPYWRLIEVVAWTTSSLESLSATRSVPPHLDEMPVELRKSIIMNRDLEKLRHLTLHDWPINIQEMFFRGCKYLDRITYLDLSHCKSIGDGRSFIQMTNLHTLILYNVKEVNRAIDSLGRLKSLRVLDISTSGDQSSTNFRDPISRLRRLVQSLPKLTSFDISGTIMAVGIASALEHRENNPLEFLGIFNTSVDPSSRNQIPALKIAGDMYEDLILNSCEAYMNRSEMLKKCLNELFQIFRYENGQHDLDRAVKILVCALGRHPSDKMIQVAASATLFYIIKSEEAKPMLGRKIKELIVTRLLDAMQAFRLDSVMLRNGCLNLIHFRIPADVISEYTRLADILLHIVTVEDDDFLQRLGIYLLNSLACQVDGEQKTIVGNLGAIEKMLYLIESRYNRGICDEVMETAWSTMWNVTDETPINCERFLNNDGMEFFVSCMEKFTDHPELLRNMMGLLGNVSECAHLRYRLMKDDYIRRFTQLLDSQSDGIEVSYNSAGILAHIASDGADIWQRHLPNCDRDEMLDQMENAISRWEINSKRNINYRSFEPILRLLRVLSISWQAQYWAVWALANLTRVHSTKYCDLLENDGGVEVLKSFILSPRPDNFSLPVSVKCLAVITLFQYYLHQRFGNLKGLEHSNKIACFDLVESKSIVIHFLKTYEFENLAREIGINYDLNESNNGGNQSLQDTPNNESMDIIMVEDFKAHYYINNNHNDQHNPNNSPGGNDEEMFF